MSIILYCIGGTMLFLSAMAAALAHDRGDVQMAITLATCAAFFLTGARLVALGDRVVAQLAAILAQMKPRTTSASSPPDTDSVSLVSFTPPPR